MGKFDTHGGYFAPKDYFRVNTGGSHEENPNGGVQIGMDSNGVPNMLEEDEPVYKDFVYSDNIEADRELLKKFNIPEKFAGKLYSEIADLFVDEASERPNDPVSNNGLNAMLVRLANAQEEQKRLKEQKDLEEELSRLSPEELAELEQMLAQREGGTEAVENPQAAVPEVGQEQVGIPQMMPQPPVMARGGLLRRFDVGGDMDDEEYFDTLPAATAVGYAPSIHSAKGKALARKYAGQIASGQAGWDDVPASYRSYVSGELAGMNVADSRDRIAGQVMKTVGHFVPGADSMADIIRGDYGSAAGNAALDIASLGLPLMKAGKLVKAARAADFARDARRTAAAGAAPDAGKAVATAGSLPSHTPAGHAWRAAVNPFYVGQRIAKGTAAKGWSPWLRWPATVAGGAAGALPATAVFAGVDKGIDAAMTAWRDPGEGRSGWDDDEPLDMSGVFAGWDYAAGGPVRRFDEGSAIPARSALPVWPRYMGAVTSGLTGLFDVFQKPDRYNLPAYRPTLPSGHMDIMDAQYNPLDQNQVVNGVIASGTNLMRGLGNSGLGPSTAATMLAGDYNIGQNIGTGLAQVWEANNRRRNDVVGQHNAGAQARGQFNYGVSRDRAQMLNNARIRNDQNSLFQQRLNYAAEGDKYSAISNQLDQVGQALSNIGRENFVMNQVNSMADYEVLPDGRVVYSPRARGGRLMRMYKGI